MKGSTGTLLIGLLLAAFGTIVLIRGISVPEKHSLEVAGIEVSATESNPIPTWVGVGALVAGLVVAAAGLKGRKAQD